jgi:hypothetical protein
MNTRLTGRIERRLLVNYRADPAAAVRILPAGMRPVIHRDYAVAGICLLRLGQLRPSPLPAGVGLRSESVAHRVAVEWDTPDGPATGVYVSRRDSSSLVNVLLGGRSYPGVHGRASFSVKETESRLRVSCRTADATMRVYADVTITPQLTGSRLFANVAEASTFFAGGARGYSPDRHAARLEGLELHTTAWSMAAAQVNEVHTTFFDDPQTFPPGTAELDCALVMRGVPVSWARLPALAIGA